MIKAPRFLPDAPPMPLPVRGAVAAVLSALLAAAVARADLGADTASSVLASGAFFPALLGAFVLGLWAAPAFGRRGAGVLAWSVLGAALAASAAGAAAVICTGLPLSHLAHGLWAEPMSWGAALAAWPAAQGTAWRLMRGPLRPARGQSRK